MTWTIWRVAFGPAHPFPSLLLGVGLLAGCGALDVSDPTKIEEEDLRNGASAELMRRATWSQLYVAAGEAALTGGLLTDEFLPDPPAWYEASGLTSRDRLLDQRRSQAFEQMLGESGGEVYRMWHEVRRSATVAIDWLRAYAQEPPRSAHIGQMLAVRGFATLRLAEDICPGFPLKDVVDYKPIYTAPLTTEEVLQYALADFDSALVYAADSARILDFARLGRARTLLGLGQFDEAGTAAAPVAMDFLVNAEFSNTSDTYQPNPLLFGEFGDLGISVADREGGTGIDFVTAADPRVQTTPLGTANDGVTGIYAIAKYPDRGAPIVVASGIEARLIQAEAVLNGGDDAWLTILNDLRATQISPALPALADPGADAGRVDLLFRERAFWLFATGHRLGDVRRLIGRYGRGSETVFPTGPYRLGGNYESATSIPFRADWETPHNPTVTGCTAR